MSILIPLLTLDIALSGANNIMSILNLSKQFYNGLYYLTTCDDNPEEILNTIYRLDIEHKLEYIDELKKQITNKNCNECIKSINECIKEIQLLLVEIYNNISYNKSLWIKSRAYNLKKYNIKLNDLNKILDNRINELLILINIQPKQEQEYKYKYMKPSSTQEFDLI